MESKIDFKGNKFAVVINDLVEMTFDKYIVECGFYTVGCCGFPTRFSELHTNPDYKEIEEMNSNKLADEIMQKGKDAVYTQEMFDNGEVPLVGMTFICKEKTVDSRISDFLNKVVEVIGVSILNGEEVITFSHEIMGIGCGRFSEEWVKPIDQRTDSEKAIDSYILDTYNVVDADYADDAMDVNFFKGVKAAFKAGMAFTGDKK